MAGDDERPGRGAGPARGGTAATVVAVLAVIAILAGLVLLGVAIRGDDAEPRPELSDPGQGTQVQLVPLPMVQGCWKVAPGEGTYVGYRMEESIMGVATPSEVTGRTSAVEGGAVIARETVTGAIVAADLRELRSDDPERDEALRTRGLETDLHPNAVFAITDPIPLPAPLTPGVPVPLTATGTLSLHGVEHGIEVPLEAQVLEEADGNVLEVAGSAPVVLADFGIEPPDVAGVLSVADQGELDVRLRLVPDAETCAAVADP